MARIAMVGAGSVVFATRLVMDILSIPELQDSTFALTDIDSERLDTSAKMVQDVADSYGAGARVEATLDRRKAIAGADYVLNMVQVGMHESTLLDFEIPRKYGLKQTIADTLGVGGVFRTLRTIPVLLDIVRDMEAVAPDALLLNYTNPMAMLVLAVGRAAPQLRQVGLCHSVQGTSKLLAKYIGAPYEEVSFRVAGINHMAWFLEFKWNGEDAYPLLWEAYQDPERRNTNKVRFEMMRRLGYFVTESSEHMAEYTPYFLKRDSLIAEFDIPVDEYIRRSIRNLNRYAEAREKLNRGEKLELTRSHEYAADIIRSIETGADWHFYGNVMNTHLIANLPLDCAVEVPILVNKNGLQPVHMGALPPHLAAMNRTNINVQQLTVEAALTGSRDHVYHAVMMDPHTASVLSLDEIWRMTDELIEAHGSRLPKLQPRRLVV